MRINPKPYTLDALERDTLRAALDMYAAAKFRTRQQLKGRDDTSRRAIERNEMQQARAADLLALLAD